MRYVLTALLALSACAAEVPANDVDANEGALHACSNGVEMAHSYLRTAYHCQDVRGSYATDCTDGIVTFDAGLTAADGGGAAALFDVSRAVPACSRNAVCDSWTYYETIACPCFERGDCRRVEGEPGPVGSVDD